MDAPEWPELKERLRRVFRTKTRDEWCAVMEGTDVCFAPVLASARRRRIPTTASAGTFIEVAGTLQPRPAPRFSRTDRRESAPTLLPRPAHRGGAHRLGLFRGRDPKAPGGEGHRVARREWVRLGPDETAAVCPAPSDLAPEVA